MGQSLSGPHTGNMIKATFFALVSVASAQNVVVAPATSYGAAPGYVEPVAPPQPYAYEYGVADDYSNSNFKKAETQDANGNVAGSFTIALPDGRIQTTTYTADPVNGFVAEVSYEGTPVYPPEPAEGYGHKPTLVKAAPVYKAAPVVAAPVYKAAPVVAAPVYKAAAPAVAAPVPYSANN